MEDIKKKGILDYIIIFIKKCIMFFLKIFIATIVSIVIVLISFYLLKHFEVINLLENYVAIGMSIGVCTSELYNVWFQERPYF